MLSLNKNMKQYMWQLEKHLRNENPLLVETVREFQNLDKIGRGLGLISKEQSYATQIPWWPLISVLGTFSAGKSTFINSYLGKDLQKTGNQAVDEKFTVICYADDEESRVLPGVSLDADPRFPFYQMADEIEKVAPSEGDRVNSYLQMKTCASEQLKGSIFIDSPGFDADEQRTSTLRITDYIIDLSDLVLVFFDARHPEPGAMRDTLKHLVTNKIYHSNREKFVYILNQIDTSAKEDNPEEIIASWQRALSAEGMTAGEFYTIYNPDSAVTIEDENLKARYERKRDKDLGEIYNRIGNIHSERIYRIIGLLEKKAKEIEGDYVPTIKHWLGKWTTGAILRNFFIYTMLGLAFVGITAVAGFWNGLNFSPVWPEFMTQSIDTLAGNREWQLGVLAGLLSVIFAIHLFSRKWSAATQLKHIRQTDLPDEKKNSLISAFKKNTGIWHSVFRPEPVGWSNRTRKRLHRLLENAESYIQKLNDRYVKPSGSLDSEGVVDNKNTMDNKPISVEEKEDTQPMQDTDISSDNSTVTEETAVAEEGYADKSVQTVKA
ncbi:MAG: dynamin family protein [Gammaproteobacteria bacterium]|nr:dynamin family protein [Gammaproteobacteria bacterium]